MDIDKIIEGFSGKRKQACEAVAIDYGEPSPMFWVHVQAGAWCEAASDLLESAMSGDPTAEILADMLWEG